MSTSEASSSMKQLVEKVKKTKSRSSGSKKASKSSGKSSGSKKASKSSGSKKSRNVSVSSELSESAEPFYKSIMNKFNSNRMLWGGIALALVVVIWYYMKNKKENKNEDVTLLNDVLKNENNQQSPNNNQKINVDEEVRKAFLERDEIDRKNNIVRLKLPDKYMTDDDGRPVILTPQVIENIQRHTQEQNKQEKNIKKKKQRVQVSDEESDNIKSQDLSNTEMEEIREQLDMMDNTNTIMPSNN